MATASIAAPALSRCAACTKRHNCVPSEGPLKCEVAMVGEAPGGNEDRLKRPFVGKAGKETREHYFKIAGLPVSRVRILNAIRCLPDTTGGKINLSQEKHKLLLESCAAQNLYPELAAIDAKVLVPVGAFACYALDKEINLELHHGIPLDTRWGVVFPMYHPAGGIHEPKKMILIRNDWIRLGNFLKGTLRVPQDTCLEPDYRVADPDLIERDLHDMEDYPLACDTETRRNRSPFCLTYSVRAGTGRMIRADDHASLALFQEYVENWQAEILWHNWLFDHPVTGALGLRFPPRRIVDTMQRVFHLGNLPQGLKALAFRELGMDMEDFDDLVTPYSAKRVLDYYTQCYLEEWPTPEEQLVRNPEGLMKIYRPQNFSKKLSRLFLDLSKEKEKNVFEMWEKNWEAEHEMVEAKMGPWPGKDIQYAWDDNPNAVIRYACRDSDALLRLWPVIRNMAGNVRKLPQDRWGRMAA